MVSSPVGGKDVPSQVPTIFGVNIAFTAVTVTIVILRVWTRFWFVQGLKVDDYIMIVSAVGFNFQRHEEEDGI